METVLIIIAVLAVVGLSAWAKAEERRRRDAKRRSRAASRPRTRYQRGQRPSHRSQQGGRTQATEHRPAYPGDFTGKPTVRYSPHPDGQPDPGEIVWTWVPFEEDHTRGKDRPVLLIGHDGPWLLGLQLTSKDHDLDAAQEARYGRYWVDIGTGDWDRQRRPSEVRLDRIVRIAPETVRREGAILDRHRFDAVASSLSGHHHW
ncbi:type II toxin-antitoxin system PemK/MazF family toxin [Demequina flava]|uniref:type II toxin-antitoxin system PemK/MazF family toxin n=1 Tax=Demequina flava TaxID=1095025 RepID=UPI0009E3C6F7|nr:type II toxin-antitoxin system PemK/MazF family toxin [Demequina flava]